VRKNGRTLRLRSRRRHRDAGFYALEDHSPWYILAFAGACALASVYGFAQGAWPFGLVEAVWTVVAIQRWRKRIARPVMQR